MKFLKTLIPGPIPMPRERFEVQHRNISEYIMFKNLFYISSSADRCPRDCLKRYIEPLWLTYNTPATHNHGLLKIKPPTTSSFILMVAWNVLRSCIRVQVRVTLGFQFFKPIRFAFSRS